VCGGLLRETAFTVLKGGQTIKTLAHRLEKSSILDKKAPVKGFKFDAMRDSRTIFSMRTVIETPTFQKQA